jgi:methyl-accepting chemotaxis protein
VGDLENVRQVVRLGGFFAVSGGHDSLPAAMNGASDLMAEITAAAVEQSTGIGQVSQAVTHMDEATQQNAALVEETAAAAESLRAQTDRLARSVGTFRLA